MMNREACYFCGSLTIRTETTIRMGFTEFTFVKCPVCGRYEYTNRFAKPEYKDIVAAYLYHHDKGEAGNNHLFYYFMGTDDDYAIRRQERNTYAYHATIEEIKAFYPQQFSNKLNLILLALAQKSEFFGKIIEVTDDEIQSLLFIRRFNENGDYLPSDVIKEQYTDMLHYLCERNYIQCRTSQNSTRIKLLADGWKAIENLQSSDKYNKDVFVAMSFNEELNPIRDAIKQGTTDAGFSAEFMDRIIHNKEIVPEMFRLIRASRFLIMDISEPNYGAYYEAGYARGLGKEIIITCRKDVYDKKYTTDNEKQYEKYLKPHFDIAQKQILIWKDYDDLAKQLKQWILALFS